jgi:hypothetical protein
MSSGAMSVAIANVAPTTLAIVAIVNATPNQPRNVGMTHASTNTTWLSATIA